MLYIVSQVNTIEWFVHSMTILLASHRNGSPTLPCGQMAKNLTSGYFEWILRSNHMTIQLHRCS